MIPGISTGGGGFSGSSTASARLETQERFDSRIGGNAGITFGQSKATSLAWPIAISIVALVLGARYLKKRG